MENSWSICKRILCIRPDNMGDLLMSSPAIRALKKTFDCHITVLTSSMASSIASYIPEIDEIISFDLPWVKNNRSFDPASFNDIILQIRLKHFDAAVIFTVYSQNPLPSVMIAFMAGIPLRLAYCRENPYALLTDWVPEKEPYSFIRHQVQRDLDLVASVGATNDETRLSLKIDESKWPALQNRLQLIGVDTFKSWMIMHPGVSEAKRAFPESDWITIAKSIIKDPGIQVLFTGGPADTALVTRLTAQTGKDTFNLAGLLSVEEFILLIKMCQLVVSVNTGTVHIAAATGTAVIVLYALTNPQHTPWKATGKIFPFAVPAQLHSSNEVIRYVHRTMQDYEIKDIDLKEVLCAVRDLLSGSSNDPAYIIPELVSYPTYSSHY